MIGTNVIDIRGNSSYYLLLAPTVPYFGNKHLLFAILAIAVLSTFIALPPLLLLVSELCIKAKVGMFLTS